MQEQLIVVVPTVVDDAPTDAPQSSQSDESTSVAVVQDFTDPSDEPQQISQSTLHPERDVARIPQDKTMRIINFFISIS